LVSSTLLAISGRSDAPVAREAPRHVALVSEPDVSGHLGYRRVAAREHRRRYFHAEPAQVARHRLTERPPESSGQPFRLDANFVRDV